MYVVFMHSYDIKQNFINLINMTLSTMISFSLQRKDAKKSFGEKFWYPPAARF